MARFGDAPALETATAAAASPTVFLPARRLGLLSLRRLWRFFVVGLWSFAALLTSVAAAPVSL